MKHPMTTMGALVGLAALLAVLAGHAPARKDVGTTKQLEAAIVRVRSAKTVDARTDAAERVANLTRRIRPNTVSDKVVGELVSLLDSPDDSVRFWVATALGNLGLRAKVAIPKLRELLPKADCLNGAITSASAIRYALIKMGVKPPPPPKGCKPIAG